MDYKLLKMSIVQIPLPIKIIKHGPISIIRKWKNYIQTVGILLRQT